MSPESKSDLSRRVNNVRRDLESHVKVIRSRGEGSTALRAAQSMGKAILGTCERAVEMVLLRNALPEAANKLIMGVTEPVKAWYILDRQYGNRDLTIALAVTKLLALKERGMIVNSVALSKNQLLT